MFLRYTNAALFSVAILFSVVHTFHIYRPKSKEVLDILKNISQVNTELRDLLNIYIKLEGSTKSRHRDQIDHALNGNTENSEIINIETQDDIFANKPKLPVKPIFSFDYLSKRQGKSDSVENREKRKGIFFDDERYADISTTPKKGKSGTKLLKISTSKSRINEAEKDASDIIRDKNTTHDMKIVKKDRGNKAQFFIFHLARNKRPKTKRHRTAIPENTHVLHINTKMFKNRATVVDDSESEEEKDIQTVILRAKALRQEYGDACAVLVVRKCKKALRATLKEICKSRDRKCDWKFTNDFRNHGIAACFHYFLNQPINIDNDNNNDNNYNNYNNYNNNNNNNNFNNDMNNNNNNINNNERDNHDINNNDDDDDDDISNTNSDDNTNGDDSNSNENNANTSRAGNIVPGQTRGFADFTREGYIDMACLRTLTEDIQPKETELPGIFDRNTKEVNILRGRYEKACQKSSYKKCIAAGKYASDRTCIIHDCAKPKKKALKKAYPKHCAQVYGYKGDSDSDSDE